MFEKACVASGWWKLKAASWSLLVGNWYLVVSTVEFRESCLSTRPQPAINQLPASCHQLLLVFIHNFVVRFHDIVRFAARCVPRLAGGGARFTRRAGRLFRTLLLCVERLARFAERARQLFLRGTDLVHVIAAQCLARALHRGLESALDVGRKLLAPLLRLLLHLVGETVQLVACIDFLAALLVLVRVRFGVLDHALNLVLGKSARGLDADLLFLARGLVLRGHVQ